MLTNVHPYSFEERKFLVIIDKECMIWTNGRKRKKEKSNLLFNQHCIIQVALRKEKKNDCAFYYLYGCCTLKNPGFC